MGTYRSLTELTDLTQPELFAGIIDSLKRNDEFTAGLIANAGATDRYQIKLNRLLTVPTPAVVACGDTITSQAISAGPVTFSPITYVSQFDICQTGSNLYNSFDDIVASELRGAIKGLTEKIATDAFSGNGSTGINGMAGLVGTSTAATSAALELSDLDVLFDTMLDKNGPVALVGTPAVVRAVIREMRESAGGMTYGTLAGTEMTVPQYMGVPLLKTQYATAGALYMVNLETGYKLYFGITEDTNVGAFSVQNIGTLESSLAKRMRLYAHIFGVSENPQGIARLTGVV